MYPVVTPGGGSVVGRPPLDSLGRQVLRLLMGQYTHGHFNPWHTPPPILLNDFEDELSPCPRMPGHLTEYATAQLVSGCPIATPRHTIENQVCPFKLSIIAVVPFRLLLFTASSPSDKHSEIPTLQAIVSVYICHSGPFFFFHLSVHCT